jgi:hypothetical protein
MVILFEGPLEILAPLAELATAAAPGTDLDPALTPPPGGLAMRLEKKLAREELTC